MKQKASGGTEGWKKLQTETRVNEDRNCQGNILPSGNMALKMKKTFLLQKREKQLLCLLFVLFVSLPSDSNDLLSKCFNCRWDEVLPENEKPKLFISCRFFLNLSSLCDLIFLSLFIATLQMISLSDGDWKGKKKEDYRPFLIESPMPGENRLTKILS